MRPPRHSNFRYSVSWRGASPPNAESQNAAVRKELAPIEFDIEDYFNTLWSPLAHDLTSHMLEPFATRGKGATPSWSTFPVNIVQDDKAYYLTAEMPGLSESDVSLSLEGRTLTINASKTTGGEVKTPDDETTKPKVLLAERRVKKYSRSFRLPADADEDAEVSAIMDCGVLHVSMPRKGVSTGGARHILVQKGAVPSEEENEPEA